MMSIRAPFCSACSVTDSRVGHVERHDLDALDLAQRVQAGKRLPGIGETDKHDRGAGIREGLRHRLADGGAAVGDQHAAEFRIAGHLAQMRIVGHVRGVLRRQRDCDRRAALVELEFEPHPAALDRVAMQMRDHDRTGIELHGADAPRRALAKVRIGRDLHRGFRHKRAAGIDIAERQPRRQARRAGVARRIDDGAAIEADLQGEAPLRRRGGEAMRGAAAHALRAERLPRPPQRILALGADERFGHAALASTAAQDDRPRS